MLLPHSISQVFPHSVTVDRDLVVTSVGSLAGRAGFHAGMVLEGLVFSDTRPEPLGYEALIHSLGSPISLVPQNGETLRGSTIQSRPDRLHLLLEDLTPSEESAAGPPPAGRLTGLLGLPAAVTQALEHSHEDTTRTALAVARAMSTLLGGTGVAVCEGSTCLVADGIFGADDLEDAGAGFHPRPDGWAVLRVTLGDADAAVRLHWPYDFTPLHLAYQSLSHQVEAWSANRAISRHISSMNNRFQVLSEQTSDILFIATGEGVLESSWVLDGSQLRGKRLHQVLSQPDPAAIDALLKRVLDGDTILTRAVLTQDGEPHTYELRLQSCEDGVAGVLHDETKRIQTEAALREARQEARAAAHARSAFVRTVSHEMRTPLNALVGMTELARTSSGSERDYYLERVAAGTERLYRLVEGTLDVSRIQAGELHLRPEPLDLDELIRDCATGFGDVQVLLPAVMPELELDPNRARQVLEELLSNAFKFGAAPIRLSGTIRQNHLVAHIELVVEDAGQGIAPVDRERIFEPYVRLNHADSEGVGLGLPIARAVCRAMSGDLIVEGGPSGTRMVARWTAPVVVREVPAVLVVGVMPDAIITELDYMAEAESPVEYAPDAPAALRAARQNTYGLVLIDSGLQGVPSTALARILRGVVSPACAIHIVDADADSETALLALA